MRLAKASGLQAAPVLRCGRVAKFIFSMKTDALLSRIDTARLPLGLSSC